jgi:hypothetical protein
VNFHPVAGNPHLPLAEKIEIGHKTVQAEMESIPACTVFVNQPLCTYPDFSS